MDMASFSPIVSPELTPQADRVFLLVSRGSRNTAEKLLVEQGYKDAKYQIADIAGFLVYIRNPISIRW